MQKSDSPVIRLLQYLAGGMLFGVGATANAAGYRYGVSDQAFYIPVVVRALDPLAFPRDASLIDAQGRLMLVDELLAGLIRFTGLSLEALFLIGYLVSLALIWTAIVLIGSRVYASAWAILALGAAFTLRHRIARTSANTFEPYFHPRMLAFGLGALAVAAVLRQQRWGAVALVALASLVHVTTAMWFAILIGVALAVLDTGFRRLAVGAAAAAAAILIWLATAGPLRASLAAMDEPWLQAVATKDSLFPTDWPAWAWAANLGLIAALWWVHMRRARRGDATAEDAALVWGVTALGALFLVTLPAVAAGLSLAVQFQISRVFWLVDFVATIYIVALLADVRRAPAVGQPASRWRGSAIAAIALVALSVIRGAYIMLIERADRALFAVQAVDSSWHDAMQWVAQQPRDVHLLADPGHAWKYGTSARVAAERDVLIEEVKDSALAIYSREVALRFVERTSAVGDFAELTAGRAAALAQRYDLDYLVTESDLPLPLVYRNDRFRIYALDGM